ncbi:glycosyltransferase [Yoonia sp. 2307UL14-13]|uniref:glycosyltransferase n=1 Tax=Yoonia sp. 2307UL14-13 TaxID=3126506 RepID=UPI0030A37BEF
MTRPLKSIIVVPHSIPDDRAGGRQRSLLFIHALCALGPVTLVLSDRASQAPPTDLLPGDANVEIVYLSPDSRSLYQIKPKALRRTMISINRALDWLLPWWRYRYDKVSDETLNHLISENNPDVVLFRYVDGMLRCDYRASGDHLTVVDIDDRPDLRILSGYQRIFGSWITGSLLKRYVDRSVMRHVRRYLTKAQLVYFSKQPDILPVSSAVTKVQPNVPYFPAEPVENTSTPTLLFVGSQNYAPNTRGVAWFLTHCWPEISKAAPTAELRIVGSGNWNKFAEKYRHLDRVAFIGSAPDIAAEYGQATATISPIFEGAGSQIKVIESCAFGRVVVCSRFSAVGFTSEIDSKLMVAQDSGEFIAKCLALLEDTKRSHEMGHELRQLQQKHFTPAIFKSRLRDDLLKYLAPLRPEVVSLS